MTRDWPKSVQVTWSSFYKAWIQSKGEVQKLVFFQICWRLFNFCPVTHKKVAYPALKKQANYITLSCFLCLPHFLVSGCFLTLQHFNDFPFNFALNSCKALCDFVSVKAAVQINFTFLHFFRRISVFYQIGEDVLFNCLFILLLFFSGPQTVSLTPTMTTTESTNHKHFCKYLQMNMYIIVLRVDAVNSAASSSNTSKQSISGCS